MIVGEKEKGKKERERELPLSAFAMAQPPPLELTNVLVSAQSPDAAVRQQAEQALEHLRSLQPAAYLAALAAELGGEQKPAEARQIAGLILKNALDAPSAVQKVNDEGGSDREGKKKKTIDWRQRRKDRWLSIDV